MIRAEYFKNEITDVFKYLETKTPILEEYAVKLKELRDFSDVLNKNNNKYPLQNKISLESNEFQKEFFDLYDSYFSRLSTKEASFKTENIEETKKIFIFGAENAGKSAFINNLKSIQIQKQDNLDLPTKIFNVVIDNMEIVMEDCIDKQFNCEQCNKKNRCINKAQGFILIFNASHKQSFLDARGKFKFITNRLCNIKLDNRTPILIIGNKKNDHEEVSEEELDKLFDLEKTKKCNISIEYFPVNLSNNHEKMMKALGWIVRKII